MAAQGLRAYKPQPRDERRSNWIEREWLGEEDGFFLPEEGGFKFLEFLARALATRVDVVIF